jgi:hypothetical protein
MVNCVIMRDLKNAPLKPAASYKRHTLQMSQWPQNAGSPDARIRSGKLGKRHWRFNL